MSECTHDCSSCGLNCSSREGQQQSLLAPANQYSHVKHVIAVMSGKGGVGNSLVTGLMASEMRRRGREVAVLDADITGPSVPKMFGFTDKAYGDERGILPGMTAGGIKLISINMLLEQETDPVVWRGSLISGTVKQFWTDVVWGDVDYMFVDMPPGTGDVPLTVFQSLPVDGIIVLLSPQELVGMFVENAVNLAGMMKISVLGIVENMSWMSGPHCGEKLYPFGEGRVLELASAHSLPVLAQVPIDPALAQACDRGQAETAGAGLMTAGVDLIDTVLSRKG